MFNSLKIIWVDKQSLLNTSQVLNREELISFRNRLIEMIPKGKIFTTYHLLKNEPYKSEIDLFSSVKSFGVEFLTNVIKSHPEIYSNNGESTLLRKGMSVKKDDLICFLLKREGVISALDIRDILLLDYNISNIDINQSYIRELGFYYSADTQMIYINKEVYIKKVSDYLNE
jgi:hypothetical protein